MKVIVMHNRIAALAVAALTLPVWAAYAGQNYALSGPMPADGSRSRVVADVHGKPITFGDVLDEAHGDLDRQQQVYESRRHQLDADYARAEQSTLEDKLNTLINRQVLTLEANAHHTTPLKLLATVKAPEVTDSEVRALYDSRKTDGTPPFEQVASMIRSGLENQNTQTALNDYYAKLRAKYGVEDLLQPLRVQVAAVGPSRGPQDARVTVVEFGDYQCPFCRKLEPTLQSVLQQYSHQVRFVFRNFPLTEIHPEALHAAQAAVCAQEQGEFWPMHDAIFADQAPLSIGSLRAIAGKVGVDSSKFESCVRSQTPNKIIHEDVEAGDELAVEGTPTLFIDGRYLNGAVSRETLVSVIEDELQRHAAQSVTAAR